MATRATVRVKIKKLLVLDSDLDAFIMDYFDDVWRSFSRGMTQQDKLNQLLSMKDPADIDSLLASLTTQAATRLPAPSTVDSEPLRRENSRLQRMVRDLEQQLATRSDSDPKPGLSEGLVRLSNLKKNLLYLLNKSHINIQEWQVTGHTTLDGIECSLGKFHNISCEFRYLFIIKQQPLSRDYLSLINAAEDILKQKVEAMGASWGARAASSLQLAESLASKEKRGP